jgi:hypothetical protein
MINHVVKSAARPSCSVLCDDSSCDMGTVRFRPSIAEA